MARVIWRRRATDDLNQIRAYIEDFDPAAARTVAARLRELGDSVTDVPNRGRPAPNGMPGLVSVKPYIVRYRVTGDVVQIVHIRHSRRDPLAS